MSNFLQKNPHYDLSWFITYDKYRKHFCKDLELRLCQKKEQEGNYIKIDPVPLDFPRWEKSHTASGFINL